MQAIHGYLVVAGTLLWAVACFFRPWLCFPIVLALYPLKQLMMTYLPIFALHSPYYNYLVALCVASAVLGNFLRNPDSRTGYLNSRMVLLTLLYFFVLFGVLYSPAPENAMARVRDGAAYWVMQVLLLPLAFATLRDIERTFVPSLTIGILACILFFINPQARFVSGRLTLEIVSGIGAYHGNPLATAQLGGHMAIIGALMYPRRASWVINLLRFAAIFIGMGVAVAAASRGQMIAPLLTILLFYPLSRVITDIRRFIVTAVGAAVILLIFAFAWDFFAGRDIEQMRRLAPEEWIRQGAMRSQTALRLLAAYAEQPMRWLFGLGTNYFSHLTSENVTYAHNVFIELLSENGLIGIILYLILLRLVFKDGRSLWHLTRDDTVERATAACLCAQAFYLWLLSLKQGTFVGIPEPYFIWAILSKLSFFESQRYALHLSDISYYSDYTSQSFAAGSLKNSPEHAPSGAAVVDDRAKMES